jgi:dihydroorotate dehydrogenase electron transfer subunit
MKYTQGLFPILKKENLAKDIFSFEILCPQIASIAKAGQFAQVKVDGKFLRRPISICEINKDAGTIKLVFAIKGEGTALLAEKTKNSMIDILAPLGNGFTINEDYKNVILVGGGIGVPPMVGLSAIYGDKALAINGFRDKCAVILQKEFKANKTPNIICTDDGSYGIHCFVTLPLEDHLKTEKVDMIYACGPTPMLKNISALAEKYNTPCQVSLEERMGCGIGACLVCTCKIKEENGKISHKHVCKNGPVFSSSEVEW